MNVDTIATKIAASPKYQYVEHEVIARIVAESAERYGLKRAEDEARRLLHQIWGMYYGEQKLGAKKPISISELLRLHQSTRERLPILRQFYEQIFAITGQPRSIVDYACGLNPLAFLQLGLTVLDRYQAFDIDSFTVDLLNRRFSELQVADRFHAELGDLLAMEPAEADLALLLKVLPCLELQQRGSSKTVLERQRARFIVVSYPLKSVSGKEKGMLEFYRQQFDATFTPSQRQVHELIFPNELVFVVDSG